MSRLRLRTTGFVLLGALPGCLPAVDVDHVDHAARRGPRDAEEVSIYTAETGMPAPPGRRVASFTVRRQSDRGHGAFGFHHLRALRDAGARLGCDAVVVESEDREYDALRCYRHHTVPELCVVRWDASCIRFD